MGMFDKSPAQIEKKIEGLKMEEELVTQEVAVAEKKAVIKQLNREYGSNWSKILGATKLTDLTTLRSFLSGANKGMKSMSNSFTGSNNKIVNTSALKGSSDLSHLRRL